MIEIKLQYPITIDTLNPIESVTCNRLKAKHLKIAASKKENPVDFSSYLICASTGLTQIECGELDASDFDTLVETVSSFLLSGSK